MRTRSRMAMGKGVGNGEGEETAEEAATGMCVRATASAWETEAVGAAVKQTNCLGE